VRPDAGRVALVTGASRGLGAAIAARLGADGFAVAVNYARSAAAAEEVVARIRDAGSAAEAFQADVTDEAAVGDLVARVREVLGPVHALVLNATGTQPAAAVADLTWQAHLDQLEFFVKSPMLLVREVLGDMTSAGGGRVIHVGSDIIDRALPGSSAYASAKAAQLGLARVWARELAPLGITVNTVAPGWVPVERHDAGREEDRLEYLGRVPLGRMGEPADVAGAVSYLASDDAAFVTGARLVVNGGFSVD
jgi:3-oxoacyl-[acyl-carrier protein] reductase